MGMFKQFKDLKATVHEAPAMIANAQQLGANAQAMAAAQQAAMQQAAAAPVAAAGPDFEPIAGVSLALYVDISKSLATVNYDQARAPEMAAAKGVDGASWAAAVDGWNVRIKANPAVAKQFNSLYTGR
ncbi:MAG: hypothetical protein JWN46_3127 [Acidimicrobiales bacterium]|nr:hypothetical protein [Acidimicrobiales bacterium]